MSVNKVILVGNLGKDPEVRHTQAGGAVATLRIATTERRKDKAGNWGDHTEWHTVTLFNRNAENAERFLAKGRQVYVEGRLQTRKWQDKDGQDRYSTEVVADTVHFLGGKTEDRGKTDGRVERSRPAPLTRGGDDTASGGDDYEIPF